VATLPVRAEARDRGVNVTDLAAPDDMLALGDLFTPLTPANPAAPGPRACRHPKWITLDDQVTCTRCGRVRDDTLVRRGRSSRRLGHDGERRSEKRYGWEKVGERGQITDLRGTLLKVQQKTTRGAAPIKWRGIFRELELVNDGRTPAILLSFVRQGTPADDYIVIRGSDWLALHGMDRPEGE
jgi:hypothetical protein